MALEDSLKSDNLTLPEGPALRPLNLNPTYLRRKNAGKYFKEKYGFGSEKTLAKLACLGGGPEFRKAGPTVLYEPAALDAWAKSKISGPVWSTSERPAGVKPISVAPDRVEAAEAGRGAV